MKQNKEMESIGGSTREVVVGVEGTDLLPHKQTEGFIEYIQTS